MNFKGVFFAVVPPPVTGMTLVSEELSKRASKKNVKLVTISKRVGQSAWVWRLKRICHYLKGCWVILRFNGTKKLYLVSDSGNGKLFTLLLVWLAKRRKFKVICHHHVALYLKRKSKLMSFVFRYTDLNLWLSKGMLDKAKAVYGVCNGLVVNNSFLYNWDQATYQSKNKVSKVVYLGRLEAEKGILAFLEIAYLCQESGLEFLIIGPEPSCKQVSRNLQIARSDGVVNYLGPKYEEEKFQVLRTADVLIFPSVYLREAQPLVVYEAIYSGCAVIAYDNGFIVEQLGGHGVVSQDLGVHGISEFLTRLQIGDSYLKLYSSQLELARNSAISSQRHIENLW